MEEQKCFCHFNGYEVKDAKARENIGTINKNIGTINENIGTINKNIGTTNENIGTINENIETINKNINSINTLNIERTILIGDSYSEGYGNDDLRGWGLVVRDLLGLSETNCYNLYEGGSGFVHVGNSNHTFKGLLESNFSSIENPETITRIVVCGGANETTHSKTEIENAISEFIIYAKTNFPNAKVYIGMVGNFNGDNEWQRRILLANIVLPAYRNCIKYGALYLNGVENSNKNYTLFYSDNVHLTTYEKIGEAIYNALITGYANVTDIDNVGSASSSLIMNSFTGVTSTKNDITIMRIDNVNSTLKSNPNMTGRVNIGVYNFANFRTFHFKILIPMEFGFNTSSGGEVYSWGALELNPDGNIYVNCPDVTLTSLTRIIIGGGQIVLPTVYC